MVVYLALNLRYSSLYGPQRVVSNLVSVLHDLHPNVPIWLPLVRLKSMYLYVRSHIDTRSLTSVGATTGITETAADFSSGGFSNIFAQPSYQSADVAAYLAKIGNTNAGKFTRTGRAFPDISAQGENVEIVVGGQAGLVAGTSCSSPIFASVISLLNDRLIAAGKSPLGFLNPFL